MGVPNVSQVVPGASVHIVLKADQPTGRTVYGTVGTVLTRGNHPRGIKVRLADGRIGRVQRLDDGSAPSPVTPVLGYGDEGGEEGALPRDTVGLDAYIKPGKKQKRPRKHGGGGGTNEEQTGANGGANDGMWDEAPMLKTETASCPVCGEFEGDEAAVAHHVAGHFDD